MKPRRRDAQGPSKAVRRNCRSLATWRTSAMAVLATCGTWRRKPRGPSLGGLGRAASSLASSGETAPCGVRSQASPYLLRAAAAHPAAITQTASGPPWPPAAVGSTKRAPSSLMRARTSSTSSTTLPRGRLLRTNPQAPVAGPCRPRCLGPVSGGRESDRRSTEWRRRGKRSRP